MKGLFTQKTEWFILSCEFFVDSGKSNKNTSHLLFRSYRTSVFFLQEAEQQGDYTFDVSIAYYGELARPPLLLRRKLTYHTVQQYTVHIGIAMGGQENIFQFKSQSVF